MPLQVNHIFPDEKVPRGLPYIEQECTCGVKSRKYPTGSRKYLNDQGKQISYIPPHIEPVTHEPESLQRDATWIIKMMVDEFAQRGIDCKALDVARNFLDHQRKQAMQVAVMN